MWNIDPYILCINIYFIDTCFFRNREFYRLRQSLVYKLRLVHTYFPINGLRTGGYVKHVNITTDIHHRTKQKSIDWFGDANRVNSINFNATIVKFSEKFNHPFSHVFIFILIIERELASRADQRVLRWFGHVERMDEYRIARRMLMKEVSSGRVRGRPRLGWMDGVKVAWGSRGMTVEAARQYAKDRKEWRALVHMSLNEFLAAIFAWHCVLSDHPPVLWWLSHGERRDAVAWYSWDKV